MVAAERRALIVGGGIGGLSTALALRRIGVDSTVFERAPDLQRAQVGGGLHLWPNAMLVLGQLGLDRRLERAGERLRRAEFCFWPGGATKSTDLDELERIYGAPTLAVARGDLHEALADAVGPETLRLGAACAGFDQTAESVVSHFADGSEEEGSLLLGADGLHSTVRAQLLADGAPSYVGYVIWRSVVSFEDDAVPAGLLRITWGRGQRFVFNRTGGGRIYWSAVANSPEGGGDPSAGRKQGLLERFADWPDPVTRIIEATEESAISRSDNYDRRPASRWGEGRVTLLGDAAHPMLFNIGQGACQSLEDAAVLASFIGADGNVPAALRAYEAARMPRTAALMKLAHRVGALARWRNPLACAVRNTIQRQTLDKAFVHTAKPSDRASIPEAG